jgi:hypothetical protein
VDDTALTTGWAPPPPRSRNPFPGCGTTPFQDCSPARPPPPLRRRLPDPRPPAPRPGCSSSTCQPAPPLPR